MKQRHMRLIALFSVLCLVFGTGYAAPAFGQAETGRISGTVTDQSGAVVPKAKLTVRNMDTGAERVMETNEQGLYAFPSLLPGHYSVTAEAPNLAKSERRVQVMVGTPVTVDLQMPVSGTTTAIEVIGEGGVQVNTESQTLGGTFDNTSLQVLPALNRDPYANAAAVPTASTTDPSGRGVGAAFNGLRSAGTNILLDGSANNNEFTSTTGQTIPLDAVQEMTVLTNNFTAEFGRASAAVVNVVTKSGTNDLHGSVYEYNRVSALSSTGFNDNAYGNPKATFVRNQFGGSAGGPIKKDKLFFFGNVEFNRVRSNANVLRYVINPTFLALAASPTTSYFSQYGTLRSNANVQSSVPLSSVITCPGITPANPSAPCTAITALTLPSNTPLLNLVSYSVPADAGAGAPENQAMVVGRVDWTVNNKTSIYSRYAFNKEDFFPGTVSHSAYTGFDTGDKTMQNNFLLSLVHSFSTRLTSQHKIVFNRLNDSQPLGQNPAITGLYFSPSVATVYNTLDVVLPGYLPTTPGSGIPFGGPQNFLQAYDDWTYVKGRHTLRFGGSYNYQRDNRTFGAYETPVGSFRTGGSAITAASLNLFLLGQLAQFQGAIYPQGKYPCNVDPTTGATIVTSNCQVVTPVGQPVFARSNRYHEFAFYGADKWQISKKLTLNLGLRWEYFGVQHNKNPQLDSNWYFGGGSDIYTQIRNGGVTVTPTSPVGGLWAKDWNNFAPKLGFAYDVFGNGKTVVRGGYSIAYERNFGNVTFNVIQNPPNYSVVSVIRGTDIASLPVTSDVAGPLGGVAGIAKAIPRVSLRAVNPNIRTAFAHLMSLTVEHEVFRNFIAGIDYSGSFGEKLYDIENINRPYSGNVYLGDPLYRVRLRQGQYSNINYRNDAGKSHYNAFVSRVSLKNFKNTGLTLNAHYTWSHTMDELSDTFSSSNNQFNLGYLDPFNPKVDYGNSYMDNRHRFVVTAVWELPLGKNDSGWKKHVLAGWAIAPVITARTGAPFSVYDCTNYFTVCKYADNAAGASLPRTGTAVPVLGPTQPTTPANQFRYLNFYGSYDTYSNPTGAALFDTSYCNATILTMFDDCKSDFGPFPARMNARNAFRGPGAWSFNLAVQKDFKFMERYSLRLRGEAFNVFNHANLYLADGDVDVSSNNFVDAYKDGKRNLQLSLRLTF